ncbi:hypothetical protein HPB49_002070 [Dermacentor silvarum]|uniref:Uncharacterized protein n=1 Tax=Dermacentor silvarum TaxID=543639 RepID=A0ACB8C734_DERSI|nr:hypothetical protein HPB49_002070 [Dermacentor silvarum]
MLIANTSATCRLCARVASKSFRVHLCCDRLISRGFVTADQKQKSLTSSKRKGHQPVTFPNRVFSGIQPSGVPHLGNYFGAIQKWKTLQDSGSDCVFSVVDLHSITKPHYDPNKLRENIELMTASLLACGIDPERCTLFLQSQVPEHAELSWILGCLLTTARLQHLPQLKDKTVGMKETPLGLYLYPVLQSADVMLYKKWNMKAMFANGGIPLQCLDATVQLNIFILPVSGEAGRLRHLRDPTKKMSKSSDDPRSYVALDDPPEAVRKKIKKALTDCTSKVTYEPESRPAVANLVCRQAEGLDTGQFKLVVADAAVSFLEPIQERMREHLADRARLWHILEEGSRRARQIAIRTMNEVHRASGMAPLCITDSAKSLAQTSSY